MKTVAVEIFEFNELTDEAKQVAIGRYREKHIDTSFIWEDGRATVKAFCDVFNVDTKNRSWLEPRLEYIKDDILEMSGELLKEAIRESIPARYLQRGECLLTGMCYDVDMLTPIWDFMESSSSQYTYEELICDCFYQIKKALQADEDYQYSDEAIIENIEANCYEFTKDGKFYF